MKVHEHHRRLVLAAVLPVGILAAALIWVVVGNEREKLQASLSDVARAISLSVDSEVKRTITALQVLALSDHLTDGDISGFEPEAREAMARHGGWSDVALFDADGRRLLDLRQASAASDPPAAEVAIVQQAVRDRQPSISGAIVRAESGEPQVFVAVPVVRDDHVRYVLQASTSYRIWTEWLDRQVPEHWIAAIDDQQGTIFARSERPEAFVGKTASETMQSAYAEALTGATRLRNLEGEDVDAAYHTSALSGWHVLVLTPSQLLAREVNRFTATVVAFYLVILVIAFTAAHLAARPLLSGIARLRHAIARLGSGRHAAFERTGIVEIDDAGASIVRASELLAERAGRVSQLQEELERRADAAEHANRMKDQFLGMLGHEIRNPLSAISNAVTVLLMRSAGREREMHELIKRQTHHLALLVDDLLDVSRLAQGKLRLVLQAIDLAQIVLDVRSALEAEGVASGHEFRWSVRPAPVIADPVRMTQVVRNLVNNAMQYTPAGRRIDVAVGAQGAHAVLAVSDEGIGIEPQLLARIFEPFVQAPQGLDRKSGGLGLGLAIVKQVVELHGGTIRASSDGNGKGTTFEVELPLAGPPVAGDEAVASLAMRERRLHVAVIEDHDDARRSMRLLLERHGCTVEEASDGNAGLALLLQQRFDAGIVDIGLPGLSGFDVAKRARRAGIRTPLIALSGYGRDHDRSEAAAAGFDHFIVKPLTDASLDAVLAAGTREAAATLPTAKRDDPDAAAS